MYRHIFTDIHEFKVKNIPIDESMRSNSSLSRSIIWT